MSYLAFFILECIAKPLNIKIIPSKERKTLYLPYSSGDNNRINKGAVKKEIPRKMTLHTVYAIPDLTILLLNI